MKAYIGIGAVVIGFLILIFGNIGLLIMGILHLIHNWGALTTGDIAWALLAIFGREMLCGLAAVIFLFTGLTLLDRKL